MDSNDKQMVEALRKGLHGLHIARMWLVAESKALRLAGRKTEREKVWSRVLEITAQIEVSTKELAEHMLRDATQRRGDAETRRRGYAAVDENDSLPVLRGLCQAPARKNQRPDRRRRSRLTTRHVGA